MYGYIEIIIPWANLLQSDIAVLLICFFLKGVAKQDTGFFAN